MDWSLGLGGLLGEVSRTGSSNGERTLDSAEFLVGNERRVSRVPDIDLARLQEAADILRSN